MKLLKSLLLMPLLFAAGVATAQENNYPTQARVEFVLDCMRAQEGGMNYTSLYKCSCWIDEIAEEVSYDEFVTMDTFLRGRGAAGERPEILREGESAEASREKYGKLRQETAKSCFLDISSMQEEDDD